MNDTSLTKITRARGQLASRVWLLTGVLALAMAVTLTRCSDDEMLSTGITGYNHMPDSTGWSIGGFSVDGHSGTNPQPETGGGKQSCCISLASKWHPGMKVKVDWSYDVKLSDPRTPPPPQQAEVEIPEYTPENSGNVQVHFYLDHRVKVVVSRYGIRHPRGTMESLPVR